MWAGVGMYSTASSKVMWMSGGTCNDNYFLHKQMHHNGKIYWKPVSGEASIDFQMTTWNNSCGQNGSLICHSKGWGIQESKGGIK